MIQNLDLSAHFSFPNSICVNTIGHIFISDNMLNCVKVAFSPLFFTLFFRFYVFDYAGQFLRTIGKTSVTNKPVGVRINKWGQVIVAGNHDHFNLTVFDQVG